MPNTPLVDVAFAKQWQGETAARDQAREEVLERCIAAASAAICRATCCLLMNHAFDAYFSGARARAWVHDGPADTLWLASAEHGLGTVAVTDVTSISEDGVALTVIRSSDGATFADQGEVALINDRQATVRRATVAGGIVRPRAWSSRSFNVRAVWSSGYTYQAGVGEIEVPQELGDVCCQLAWLMYREGNRNGLESLAETGASLTFVRLLPPYAMETLAAHTWRGVPSWEF